MMNLMKKTYTVIILMILTLLLCGCAETEDTPEYKLGYEDGIEHVLENLDDYVDYGEIVSDNWREYIEYDDVVDTGIYDEIVEHVLDNLSDYVDYGEIINEYGYDYEWIPIDEVEEYYNDWYE